MTAFWFNLSAAKFVRRIFFINENMKTG